MIGRVTATIASTAAVLLSTAVVAAPAHAADEVGLSLDGQTWAGSLRRPLFDPDVRWVPGDSETASFLVRNQGPSAAWLTIEVLGTDSDQLLANGEIEMSVRARGGDWETVVNGVPSRSLTTAAVAEGGRTRVDLQAVFAWDSPNDSIRDRLPLDVVVRLTQAGPVRDENAADDDRLGWLPDTGSAVSKALAWLAAILLGSGLALLAARKRESETEADVEEVLTYG